jgi:hypothetical protein
MKKVRIKNFKGCSSAFANIVNGSEHEVVECPQKYKERYWDSIWVMGLVEPVRLLDGEYEII